jgi:hypothetical protein
MIEILTSWLNSLPAWALALVLCAFFLAVTLIGIILIHPLMRRLIHSERQVNDVVIFAAANYGLIYAVLLGLLTVATFQTTKDLEDHIAEEASSLSTMYHGAEDYPEPLRSQLRADLRDYTHYVIEKDWPAHRRGETPKGVNTGSRPSAPPSTPSSPRAKPRKFCTTKSSANSMR